MANKFTRTTKVNTILTQIKGLSACPEAMTWHQKYAGKTLGTLVDNISDVKFAQGWAVWALRNIGRVSDTSITKKYIDKVTDPMMAFQLYLDLDWLSDDEEKLLEAKFKGKLPIAETELAQGKLKRKKV